MAFRPASFGACALAVIAAGCAVSADGADLADEAPALATDDAREPVVVEKWFVELEEAPLVRGGDPIVLSAEKARLHAHLLAARIPVVQRYSFDRLWNGVSLHVDHRSASALAALPGVKAIYPVVPISLDAIGPTHVTTDAPIGKPAGSALDITSALGMTGADIAQSSLGLTGAKVRVAVIDSGIDIHHPDLGGSPAGCFGPGCRIAFGYDLVGDAYDAGTSGSLPVPDAIPDDCAGHGTHVAGIIGASGVIKGVAPNVVLGAYRVFGCSGTTDPDLMLKAMEMAEADGMRVINMSIGSPFQWPNYPTAKATTELVKRGIVVVASIGNNGGSGLWAAGAPGVGESVIGVASYDNVAVSVPAFTLSPDDTRIGYDAAAPAPGPPLTGSFPLIRTGTVTTDGDGCVNPPAPGSLTGKVALIRRGAPPASPGSCGFHAKAKAAQDAGAAGVVIYNNVVNPVSPTVAGNPPITIPVVLISLADGLAVNARLDAGPVTMTWSALTATQPNPTGGRLSNFSSFGLPPDLSFKPDLGAPGGSIHSTYPVELGSYANLNGTSMAAPHVAGAVALLLEARPDVPPARVRDLLQNTAVPAAWPGNAAFADLVHRQGAGMLHIDAAIQSQVTVTPAKLSLGESQGGPASVQLSLENAGPSAISYDLSHLAAAASTGSSWTPATTGSGPATVVFAQPTITVPAGGRVAVDVTITAGATLADRSIYGGYIVFAPRGGGTTLRVPYAGLKGDYQSIQMLTPTAKGYPWVAKRPASTFVSQPSGATFTLQNGDIPYVVLHLDHGARRITIDVFDAVKGKPYGSALDVEYVGQSLSPTDSTSFSWDGNTVFNKKTYAVPNGTYVLKLAALKALGDPENPGDWERWTSPVVTINHP